MDFQDINNTVYFSNIFGYIVNPNPTCNCQLFLISSAENLLGSSASDEEIKKEFVEAGKVSDYKNLVLIDIHSIYCEKVDKIFESSIITKAPYFSTSGSNMCLYVIQISYYDTIEK